MECLELLSGFILDVIKNPFPQINLLFRISGNSNLQLNNITLEKAVLEVYIRLNAYSLCCMSKSFSRKCKLNYDN